MFRSGWPIIHFPEVLLLEFFYCDQVVLALFVGELSEADGAEEGTFLACGAEADYLDLLVLVLAVLAD